MENEVLFCKEKLDKIFNSVKKNIKKDIHYFQIHEQLEDQEQQLAQKIFLQHRINPPKIHEGDIYQISPEETSFSIDNIRNLNGQYSSDAEYTFAIPFSGDFELFYLSPETDTAPCKGIVTKNRLLISFMGNQFESGIRLAEAITLNMNSIRGNLECIERETEKFNSGLHEFITAQIAIEEQHKNESEQIEMESLSAL